MKIVTIRTGGAAAMIGGVLWTLFHLWYMQSGITNPQGLLGVIGVPGLSALLFGLALLSLLRSNRTSGAGKAGMMVMLTGLVIFGIGAIASFLFVWPQGWLIAIAGEFLTGAGLLLFAVVTLVARALPRGNALPLLMAIIFPMSLGDPSNLPANYPANFTEWMGVLYGIGWILIGTGMFWTRNRADSQRQIPADQ